MKRNAVNLILTLLMLTTSLIPSLGWTRELSAQENKVKAAFIYQFTNYIDWPESTDDDYQKPFVIAVFSESPLLNELQELAKVRTIKKRPMQIVLVTDLATLTDAQIILVESNSNLLDKILALKTKKSLIISHGDGLATKGAMINFFLEGDRLRFEINRSAMDAVKIKPSSQLLKLSRLVDQ